VHRAGLAQEGGAKFPQHAVGLDQRPPEPPRLLAVIRARRVILGEGDRRRQLVGGGVDTHRGPQRLQGRHHLGVERRHRHRLEGHGPAAAVDGAHHQLLVNEVELDVEGQGAVRDQSGGEAAGGDIEGRVPRMVQPRGQRQPHLADDLGP